jgi:hypothetical protein
MTRINKNNNYNIRLVYKNKVYVRTKGRTKEAERRVDVFSKQQPETKEMVLISIKDWKARIFDAFFLLPFVCLCFCPSCTFSNVGSYDENVPSIPGFSDSCATKV